MKKKNITDYSEFNGKKTIIESPEQEEEFNESTNSIRIELNRLTKSDLLVSNNKGRTIIYKANINHWFIINMHKLLIYIYSYSI